MSSPATTASTLTMVAASKAGRRRRSRSNGPSISCMTQRGAKATKSQLMKDIEELLAMGIGSPDEFVHHWWCVFSAGPCCANASEAKSRAKAAYLNCFVAHGLPVGALSRWAQVGMIYTM